ncbi:hypothetical protein F4777DRAFT_570008 [Nemania sp. FL0916]|nr:hypothetical protein F4777DRAFT_570008 [Nemania sp. FL0916]
MSLGLNHVEPNQPDRSFRSNTSTDEPDPSASQVTVVRDPQTAADRDQQQPDIISTSSAQMITIPHAPSPPEAPTYSSVPSEEEIYGPERYAGRRYDFPEYAASTPGPQTQPSPSVHFSPSALMLGGMQTDPLVQRDFKDDLARAAGTVTPGVSDTPFIRYAIEAITRQKLEEEQASIPRGPGSGAVSPVSDQRSLLSVARFVPRFGARLANPPPVHRSMVAVHVDDESAAESLQAPSPAPVILGIEPPQPPISTRSPAMESTTRQPQPSRIEELASQFTTRIRAPVEQQDNHIPPTAASIIKNRSPPRTVDVWRSEQDTFAPHDLDVLGYELPGPPPLIHKPWILRPSSLLLLATLIVLVITALIFSAVYSISGRDGYGFTAYAGTIYGGQYFVFRILPQLLGAVVLVYAQCVLAAAARTFPFSCMASDDRRERRGAVFLPMYPVSFLWPRLFGPWQIWLPSLVVWLTNFTIPLLSSLYTVVLVDGVWTWATVQGVAWTLVAVYVSLLLSVVVLFVYWRRRRTGMIKTWDVRSIADIIFLASQSNSLPQYRGLETAATRASMEKVLNGPAERLGYWTTPEVPENSIFWSFGVPTTEEDLRSEKWDAKNLAAQRDSSRTVTLSDLEDQKEPWAVRFRYLPWCFRDSQIIFFVVTATILLIALVVVSFLHSTELRSGFLPGLSAAPVSGAFSPADFLYSFLPSLIGLALYLGFQSLELTLRVLAPWSELSREEGSRAETSLLLDYAACLPWQSTIKAIKHRHWRVAFITFLSPLFILIPVLSGGIFMALTPAFGPVRMYPNMAIFAVVIALLFLYLAALASFLPKRRQFRLPHAVTCLAEILSFCCNEQLRTDEAFDQVKTSRRSELKTALDCGKDYNRQARWTFGAGRNNEERLGIKRCGKFTASPMKLRHYDKHVRGKPISGPALQYRGPFGH